MARAKIKLKKVSFETLTFKGNVEHFKDNFFNATECARDRDLH
jgi:hypothetical protein